MRYKKLLLVDDDADEKEILETAVGLLRKKVEIWYEPTGERALTKLASAEAMLPDFIFLDLNLPVMGGKECLRELRMVRHLRSIPIVVYTNLPSDVHKREALLLDASYYINKPYQFNQMCQSLETILSVND